MKGKGSHRRYRGGWLRKRTLLPASLLVSMTVVWRQRMRHTRRKGLRSTASTAFHTTSRPHPLDHCCRRRRIQKMGPEWLGWGTGRFTLLLLRHAPQFIQHLVRITIVVKTDAIKRWRTVPQNSTASTSSCTKAITSPLSTVLPPSPTKTWPVIPRQITCRTNGMHTWVFLFSSLRAWVDGKNTASDSVMGMWSHGYMHIRCITLSYRRKHDSTIRTKNSKKGKSKNVSSR